MGGDVFFMALGLAFALEGLMPLLLPAAWRRALQQILQLHDGQIRYFGLIAVLLGLAVFWLAR